MHNVLFTFNMANGFQVFNFLVNPLIGTNSCQWCLVRSCQAQDHC